MGQAVKAAYDICGRGLSDLILLLVILVETPLIGGLSTEPIDVHRFSAEVVKLNKNKWKINTYR